MSLLSSAEIMRMRGVADSALPGTAIILTHSSTSDGQGGRTDGYAASGTVDARLASAAGVGGEATIGDRVSVAGDYILTVPVGTSLEADDRVTYAGVTYEVSELQPFGAPWDISLRARLRLVD